MPRETGLFYSVFTTFILGGLTLIRMRLPQWGHFTPGMVLSSSRETALLQCRHTYSA